MGFKQPSNGKLIYVWWANLFTNLPVISALIGMFYAVILLSTCEGHHYHTFKIEKRDKAVDNFLTHKIARTNNVIDYLRNLKNPSKEDTAGLSMLKKTIPELEKEKFNLTEGNSDTASNYYVKYLSIKRQLLFATLSSSWEDAETKYVQTKLADFTAAKDSFIVISDSVAVVRKVIDIVSLMDENTSFGLWYITSIAQMAFWFLVIVLLVGVVRRSESIVSGLSFNLKNILFFSIIPVIAVGLFAWVLYVKIIDGYIITDDYLLDGFNGRMVKYSLPGYVATVLCFTGFLFFSNKLELFDEGLRRNGQSVKTNPSLLADYNRLKTDFNTCFFLSAAILSFFVIWTGLLFRAINSMDAMKIYTQLSGKPFLNYDLVYFIGLFHTLLLLIFYIPVRLRFNALEVKQADDAMALSNMGGVKKTFKTMWDIITTIIVTASPLLTGILQKIIGGLFE